MNCRKCDSSNVKFSKSIVEGPKQKAFHYKLHCLDCQSQYHVPRTKEIYDLVKDQPWQLSVSSLKRRGIKPRRLTAQPDRQREIPAEFDSLECDLCKVIQPASYVLSFKTRAIWIHCLSCGSHAIRFQPNLYLPYHIGKPARKEVGKEACEVVAFVAQNNWGFVDVTHLLTRTTFRTCPDCQRIFHYKPDDYQKGNLEYPNWCKSCELRNK